MSATSFAPQPSTERRSLSYDELLRELMDGEAEYIRHLNLILKVFKEPFLGRSDLFADIVSLAGRGVSCEEHSMYHICM